MLMGRSFSSWSAIKNIFGKPRLILPNGKYIRAEQTINDNEWHHVAFVISGKTLEMLQFM